MKITKIKDLNNIPEGITELDISGLGLTTLPKLSQGLTVLDCSINKLTSLENLPQGLTTLYCNSNELKILENLPQGLTVLDCSRNKLTSLENLPQELNTLICIGNKLTSLDIAHCYKLKSVRCNDNNFPGEMQTILDDEDLTIQEKINKLIKGCLIPNDNSYVLK